MPVIEGAFGTYQFAGAAVSAVNAIQTLTFGATGTGGTYRLAYQGFETGNIAYSTVNATLLAALQAALDTLAPLGTNGAVATAGTLVAGVGTVLLTFSGTRVAGRVIPTMTITSNAMTPANTLTLTTTTAGVEASGRGAAKGALAVRLDTGVLMINTGTAAAPVWTVVGAQT